MLNRLAGFIHPDRSEALHGGLRWRCDFERLHRHAILDLIALPLLAFRATP
ncbi:MAG: hypothetical protein H6948_03895 [Zoogloeaceae bacterium]|nr:hypothetical protein [Zoogloeaceae bacterium]MCP5252993.1 hypothetical protein [Zoogloeaceae bacterium]